MIKYILMVVALFVMGCDGGGFKKKEDQHFRGLSDSLIRHEDKTFGVVCYELVGWGTISCLHRVY